MDIGKHGCLGLPLAAEESDLNLVDTAFKLLTSKDEHVQMLAVSHLRRTVQQRIRCEPSDEDLGEFMSGVIEGRFATSSNKLSNTWTVARSASRRLDIEWTFVDGVPRLAFEDLILKPQQRRRILHSIRDRLRTNRSLALHNKLSQGKALKLVSLSPASSHFITDGRTRASLTGDLYIKQD
ncbi:hypothetical protein CDAR_493181 [Caerostris darwini]|uniref:Uncharacterized protein n=1 Tax=Caerostris darwini TaxID=1538125 RepID=A0AAV4TSC5_9ARAC|nr:hypothetical protein CDAR_493181 [Caerostris darwini]